MKVLLFANWDFYLYNFRLPLLRAVRTWADEVVLVVPRGEYNDKLSEQGFRVRGIPLQRHSLNPVKELRTLLKLINIYKEEAPDLVHHFTVKGVLYGSIASHVTGVEHTVNAITGGMSSLSADNVYQEQGLQAKGVRAVVKALYRLTLSNTHVIFQNRQHQRVFIQEGLVPRANAHLIRSSGVDIEQFAPPDDEPERPPVVLLAGRLLWTKGVGDFVEAARKLKRENVRARFVLVGDTDPGNPGAIPPGKIHEWEREDVLEWWGFQNNMADVFSSAHIVCLPSYGEALPKTLIEAASCGRPLVAADVVGCRAVVRHGKNGMLVPARDADALKEALKELIYRPDKRQEMGRNSREVAVQEFSAARVVRETLAVYEQLV